MQDALSKNHQEAPGSGEVLLFTSRGNHTSHSQSKFVGGGVGQGSDIWDFVCIEVEAGALGFTGSLFIDEFKTQEQEFKAQEEKNKQLKQ